MKLRTKFLISIIALIISMNLIFTSYIISEKGRKKYIDLETQIHHTLNSLSINSSIPLWNFEFEIIEEQLKISLNEKNILKATILSKDQKTENLSFSSVKINSFDKNTLFHKMQSVKYNGEIIGYLEIVYSDFFVKKELEEQKNNMILLTIFLIIVISIAVNLLLSYFLKPIDKIVNGLEIIDNGNLDFILKLKTNDEFNKIEKLFNSLRENLKDKQEQREKAEQKLIVLNNNLENKIKDRTFELENSIHELKHTQNQLIQSEKMSMLGRMVAGVTHEINSPLGICVTLSSNLSTQTDEIKTKYSNSKMKKKDFDNFLSLLTESSKLILSNINRATEIIKSFKTIAVDQTSEYKRTFLLDEYLDDIVLILKNKFKNRKIELKIFSNESISIYNNPGIFYQIFTNLINNSLKHGFENETYGEIRINLYLQDNFVVIDYSDNGKGINDNIKSKVFDKFFTTKREDGGSGLGLHIISNLIKQNLNGTIELLNNDKDTSGVFFRIKIKK